MRRRFDRSMYVPSTVQLFFNYRDYPKLLSMPPSCSTINSLAQFLHEYLKGRFGLMLVDMYP